MPTRSGHGEWKGDLKSGSGTVRLQSGRFEGPYSFPSRFESGEGGTNPEELLGASLAACYAMALSNHLAQAGHEPERVNAEAKVHLDMEGGPKIARIDLVVEGVVPGIDEATFQEHARKGCPISKAIAADIAIDAKLAS